MNAPSVTPGTVSACEAIDEAIQTVIDMSTGYVDAEPETWLELLGKLTEAKRSLESEVQS